MRTRSLFNRIKKGLAAASAAIIAAPVKLPPKVVLVAKYVALAVGILEAVGGGRRDGHEIGEGADENE